MVEKPVLFKLISGKYHRTNPETGRREVFRKGDTFYALPSKVKGFMDIMEPVDPEEMPDAEPTPFVPKVTLKMLHRGGGRFIVINEETGEKIHDGYLTKQEAEALTKSDSMPVTKATDLGADDDEKEKRKKIKVPKG